MFNRKRTPPSKPFIHADDCRVLKADPDVPIPWNYVGDGSWRAECVCTFEIYVEPAVDERVRLDPLDPKTSRHLGQCEYASETDPGVLKFLLKVKPGLGEGYDWVECGACDRLAGSALRRRGSLMDEGYRAALSYFRAVEHTPMDDAHNALAGDLVEEYGEEELMAGLALVASFMRDAIRAHAAQVGCDCGSDAWLDRAVYANAVLDDHDG